MNKLSIATALSVCICLSSCVTWDIGGCIRHAGDRYQGIDIDPHRTDAPLRDGSSGPEVTYRLNRPLVTCASFIGGKIYTPTAEDVQATGRTVPVTEAAAHGYYSLVPSENGHDILQTGVLQSPGITRRVLAAPFDFIIDPALTLLSSPFVYFFQKYM